MTDLQKIKIAITTLKSLDLAKNQEEVGKLMGYKSPSSFSQVVNGIVPLPKNFIEKIRSLHPDINNIWETKEDYTESAQTPNISKVIFSNKANMYWVPLKAYGGFLTGYENKVFLENLEKTSFPLIRAECYAFEIGGLSMTPDYSPGEFFVGTIIEDFTWLVKGRVYVFQTIDGLILKCFEKIEGDYAYLYSINNDHNPVKPIFLKDIKVIYHREFVIKK